MSRGTLTKTSQSGSPKNFAHLNKLSILAPDGNDFNGECCAPKHTSTIQCQPRRYGDERVDECRRGDDRVDECITAPETKVSSHRGSCTSKLRAHQVSYFAASGGDSKGVHRVSGSGWRRLSAIMDSGSADCVARESFGNDVPLLETEALRKEQTYHTADGGVIKNKGEKTVTMHSETGDLAPCLPSPVCLACVSLARRGPRLPSSPLLVASPALRTRRGCPWWLTTLVPQGLGLGVSLLTAPAVSSVGTLSSMHMVSGALRAFGWRGVQLRLCVLLRRRWASFSLATRG